MKTNYMFVPPGHVSVEAYVEYLAAFEAAAIHGVGQWYHDVLKRAAGADGISGAKLPWAKTFNDFRLRPNEVTIWAGYRGHMKSFVTGMVGAWLARDVRIGIASFEMPPQDTIWRMICQSAGTQTPSPEYCDQWITAMDPMIRIYDQSTTLTPHHVMAVVHHLAYDLGCSHIFIDSLMKVGLATDDFTGQKQFVEQLTLAAKRYGVHIHLIAHLRKPAYKTNAMPNSDDVAGGSDITNLADNVVIVWNDKPLMEIRAKAKAGVPLDSDERERMEDRTHILKLDKHRRGQDQICWLMWFHDRSTQFLPENRNQAMPWLPADLTFAQFIKQTAEVAA